jgi:hypothetical protein
MNKSNIISETLRVLELQAANVFSDLLNINICFNFLLEVERDCQGSDEEILDELKQNGTVEQLPFVEMRNDITGNVFDVYVTKVTKNGIHTIEIEDYTPNTYRFSDLSSLNDRLILLNEMEETL